METWGRFGGNLFWELGAAFWITRISMRVPSEAAGGSKSPTSYSCLCFEGGRINQFTHFLKIFQALEGFAILQNVPLQKNTQLGALPPLPHLGGGVPTCVFSTDS